MRRMAVIAAVLGCLLLGSASAGAAAGARPANEIYQVSVINALLQGDYDGEITIGELKKHGDFGIGTFDALDGELVAVDGRFYQVKASGEVAPAGDGVRTPFATVVRFKPDQVKKLAGVRDYDQLQKALSALVSDANYFYAVRVDGVFSYVKTRSVPAQSKPYRPLAEVTKTQPVFEYGKVRGTVVGFWCPQYVNGVNVPGYHLHFVSADRDKGGHLLAVSLEEGEARVARIRSFRMVLPSMDGFRKAALGKDYSKELKAVEQ